MHSIFLLPGQWTHHGDAATWQEIHPLSRRLPGHALPGDTHVRSLKLADPNSSGHICLPSCLACCAGSDNLTETNLDAEVKYGRHQPDGLP